MTYKRRDWHFWQAAPATAIVATLAMVGGFLAPSISPASAATTHHDGAHHDHDRGAGFELLRFGERDLPRPHRLVGHHRRSF